MAKSIKDLFPGIFRLFAIGAVNVPAVLWNDELPETNKWGKLKVSLSKANKLWVIFIDIVCNGNERGTSKLIELRAWGGGVRESNVFNEAQLISFHLSVFRLENG